MVTNGLVETVVPPGVVTEMKPVVAPTGTVTVSWVAETTVNVGALTPLNATVVAPVKKLPVRVTTVPATPAAGVNEVIIGAGMTVKLAAEVAVPVGVVTLIGPVVAPAGTVTVI